MMNPQRAGWHFRPCVELPGWGKWLCRAAVMLCSLCLAGAAIAGTADSVAPPSQRVWQHDGLANLTYAGLADLDGPITLSQGSWQGEPFVAGGASRPRVDLARDFQVEGDLGGDAEPEVVVVLSQSFGGSGSFDYLAVVGRRDGAPANLATVAIGDRVSIRRARIEAGVLRLDVLRAGAGDAMCCPGELAELAWTLGDGALHEAPVSTAPMRLSLDALAGTEWVLVAWDRDEPVPASARITLTYRDGTLAGRAGCNGYFTSPETSGTQALPGALVLGPIGSTLMACAPAEAAVEQHYLARLGAVRGYGFTLGRLALRYMDAGGSGGTLVFESSARD